MSYKYYLNLKTFEKIKLFFTSNDYDHYSFFLVGCEEQSNFAKTLGGQNISNITCHQVLLLSSLQVFLATVNNLIQDQSLLKTT